MTVPTWGNDVTQAERNRQLALEYLAAFRTFEPANYERYLAAEPTYKAGMNTYRGREAFFRNTAAGKVLYPKPAEAEVEVHVTLAEGDWVAVLLTRRAVTNTGADYENIYSFWFEIVDDKIQTQVEMLDFRVAQDKFDLSALDRADG